MKYIFDFDRTLFNIEAAYDAWKHCDAQHELGTVESLNLISVSDFVFKDALAFLQTHSKEDMYIVSSCHGTSRDWSLPYQKAKIEQSGVGAYVQEILVVEMSKAQAVASLCGDGPVVFIDDFTKHLADVKAACPQVQVVRIDRFGQAPAAEGEVVIESLDDLDASIT